MGSNKDYFELELELHTITYFVISTKVVYRDVLELELVALTAIGVMN